MNEESSEQVKYLIHDKVHTIKRGQTPLFVRFSLACSLESATTIYRV